MAENPSSARKLRLAAVAERAGVAPKTFSGYVARDQAPKPDGHYDARTPWWYASTIDAWMSSRPRRNTHTEGSTR